MNTLSVFEFQSKNVHCYGTWDCPIWVAQDVCDCLDLLGDAGQHTRRLDEDEKVLISIQTPGGAQDVLGVTEPGLYNLVLGCRKPIAKQFKRWLTHEVIPSIRKSGTYTVGQVQEQVSVKDEIDVLNQCLSIAGLDPRLIAGVALNHAGTRMPQLKQAVSESHGLLAAAGQNDLLLTPSKIGERLGVSGQKVNKVLLDLGFQVKNTSKKSKTEPDYFATESGKQYAGNTMATGELRDKGADNTTYQHLKWKESVIDIVRQNLAA